MVAHKAALPNRVEGLLEIYEDMVEVLLVLCGAPSCCEACLFFSDDLLRLWLQSVQYDLQHVFVWVTDEADRSVVLALLQVVFLWKCDNQGLGPQGWPFSCLSDLVADYRESGDYILSTCLDQFYWDVVNSS